MAESGDGQVQIRSQLLQKHAEMAESNPECRILF